MISRTRYITKTDISGNFPLVHYSVFFYFFFNQTLYELKEFILYKLQKLGCVSDMLATMKLLCLHMWPNEVKNVDDLRLHIALRMLKSPHFNAKMNSLKEVRVIVNAPLRYPLYQLFIFPWYVF